MIEVKWHLSNLPYAATEDGVETLFADASRFDRRPPVIDWGKPVAAQTVA